MRARSQMHADLSKPAFHVFAALDPGWVLDAAFACWAAYTRVTRLQLFISARQLFCREKAL